MSIPKLFCIGIPSLTLDDSTKRLLDRGVGGIILFSRNVQNPSQVAKLCHDLKAYAGRPLLVTIDQEGGRVARLREGFTSIPSMRDLGATGDENLAREIGAVLGKELKAVGIDLNFAPVMDVDSNPANPVIGNRSFARDAQTVSRMGCALIAGMQGAGVAACAKHFPGHGDTDTDSHLALPRLSHDMQRLEEVELKPFQAAIKADVASIMSAHVVFEGARAGCSQIKTQEQTKDNSCVSDLLALLPATLSKSMMTDLLSTKMGFGGLRISDCMEMKAIANGTQWNGVVGASVKAIQAGVDFVLISHKHELVHQAIEACEKAQLLGERVADANARLDALMARYFSNTQGDLSILNCEAHRTIAGRVSTTQVGTQFDPTVAMGGK